MSRQTTILVIGAAPGSFGDKLVLALRAEMRDAHRENYADWRVVEAGVHPGAQLPYDVVEPLDVHQDLLGSVKPWAIIYAAGTNWSDAPGSAYTSGINGTLANSAMDHFEVNVAGFLRVAEAFKGIAYAGSQLVAVSSNSARIPRSPSVGYCASKAALSMAVRVLARRWRGEPVVWAVEPGLMNTDATIEAVNAKSWTGGGQTVMHRMRGVSSQYGLSAAQVAENVAHQVLWGGIAQNGTLWQLDAGEL